MTRKIKKKSGIPWQDIRNTIFVVSSLYSLFRQLTAPNCPYCNTKLFFLNNYCIKCNTYFRVYDGIMN